MFGSKLVLAAAAAKLALGAELAMYWGQQNYGDQRSLAEYCQEGAADIMILAFLNTFGNGRYPSGSIYDCNINEDQSFSGCEKLSQDIDTCHGLGKKVFLSVGGGGGDISLPSQGDAEGVAYSLWNSWARPAATSNSPRPIGDSYVDGWDFDIESNPNGETQAHLGQLVNKLRSYFSQDSGNTYYIAGAPQCPIPEGNMGNSIMEAQYDYLFIQFYNNFCAAADLVKDSQQNPDGPGGTYNFADWPSYISGGASANAKLHVGLPGDEAEVGPSGFGFVPAANLAEVIANSEGVNGYNGIMIYDAGDADTVNDNGCNYSQSAKRVLDTGSAC